MCCEDLCLDTKNGERKIKPYVSRTAEKRPRLLVSRIRPAASDKAYRYAILASPLPSATLWRNPADESCRKFHHFSTQSLLSAKSTGYVVDDVCSCVNIVVFFRVVWENAVTLWPF